MLPGRLIVLKPQKELIDLHFSNNMQRRFNKLRAFKTPLKIREASSTPWTGLSTLEGEPIRTYGTCLFLSTDTNEWPSEAFTVLNSKRR